MAAFIYYLSQWSSDWGGELDLFDCKPENIPATGELADSVLAAPCNMTSIVPRSNRLVVMQAPTVHRIRRVDQLAGTHIRQSISGFLSAATLPDEART
ncbi:2OG-Fe(II) oxygenase family protein [Mycolicibacterium sarraceniae]|uniref:2OG-Fe(II) oxygenase family protein n=1 Tax=Mycolicibacterium sarraceniae TaxID=1534348 RepID=UPI0013D73E3B